MQEATRTWISSTAAAESTGLAAARAVLEWHDRVNVPQRLEAIGTALKNAIGDALRGSGTGSITVDGPPQMFRLVTQHEAELDAFVAAAATHGVLFKRGAYQFASLAHDEHAIAAVVAATRAAGRTLTDTSAQ